MSVRVPLSRPIALGAVALFAALTVGRVGALSAQEEAWAVPGTQVVMPPPAGFSLSERFSGFEDTYTSSSVLIVEMPAEAFRDIEQGLTAEALAERGIALRERRVETIGDLPALWITGTQAAEKLSFEKRLLLLGGSVTVLLTATVPTIYADPPRLKSIEEAMRAARLSENRGEGRAVLPFAFDEVAGFRYRRTLAGHAAILVEEEPLLVANRPAVFIVSLPLSASCPDYEGQEEAFGRRTLGQLKDFVLGEVVSSRRLELGESRAVEHVAVGTSTKGEAVTVVQTLVFRGCRYLRSVGMAPHVDGEVESDAYLQRFQALASTMRFR